jgi:hypothetical protein
MTLIHSVALMTFAVLGVFLLGISWLAFIWWFLLAVMLSQLTTVAELHGEYRYDIPLAHSGTHVVTPAIEKTTS